MTALLELRNVSRAYGGICALDRLSLEVYEGEVLAVVGPNGAGKTTLFDIVTGFVRPDQGSVLWLGREITSWPSHRIAAAGIGRTFQDLRLFPEMTVLENVWLAANGGAFSPHLPGFQPRRDHLERADGSVELLRSLGIHHLSDRSARGLAGGERKLLALARLLAARPRLALLDEPVAGLTSEEKGHVAKVVRGLKAEGRPVVLIEHDTAFAASLADRVLVLASGEVVAQGPPSEVLGQRAVREALLGVREA